MQIFLVGGAVRDELLGIPVTERDWVVVGASPDELLGQGYRSVGKDFPVFLHPETHEEYALARTERKTAPGYHGFSIHADAGVTLEEDLLRRDLTVNAMARDSTGRVIDPYHGRQDLESRVLRHVSPAFAEDPVRILRVARFAARYAHLGFTVADETMVLMREMVTSGEVDALVAERVWAEFVRALGERSPPAFLKVLRSCGACAILFQEVDRLFGVPGLDRAGAPIDLGRYALKCLQRSVDSGLSVTSRFALLMGDLGKPLTPPEKWPHHSGHQGPGSEALDEFCARLKVPREFRQIATAYLRFHEQCDRIDGLDAESVLTMLKELGGLRKQYNPEPFLGACACSFNVGADTSVDEYPQAGFFSECRKAALAITTRSLADADISGAEIGRAIWNMQLEAIAERLQSVAAGSRG